MKKFLVIMLLLLPVVFTACKRDEIPVVVPPVPVVKVVINEVYSQGTVGNADWIELYNPSTAAITLSGYKIYDNGGKSGSKPKRILPAGTSIPAGGFFVITTDDTLPDGFGLSSGGETVWLEDASGVFIDSLAFPALGIDTSYGRNPNGSATYAKLSPPTKNAVNGTGGTATLPLMMNELYSRGITTAPDWVEIYNPNPVSVSLAGYKIYDPGGNTGAKPKKPFPADAVIPANGYYVIVVDDSSPDGSGFGLGSGGDEVWFENPAGTLIDHVVILAMTEVQSWSRVPNGSATWVLSNTITRGAPNQP